MDFMGGSHQILEKFQDKIHDNGHKQLSQTAAAIMDYIKTGVEPSKESVAY